MRLVAVTLENFRSYQDSRRVEFSDLTTIIGRNDIGKSTILDSLEIFFNGDKIDQGDANVRSGSNNVKITAEFSDLPAEISLDAGAMTTLAAEYLLSVNGSLIIQKVYDCSKKSPSCETFIIANHPTAAGGNNLLELKERDLQSIVKERGLVVRLKGNPGMRQAIWQSIADLQLEDVAIPVSKSKEDGKRVWEQVELHLPMFALFQSDRASKDSDGEVQDPMKGAIQSAIAEAQDQIEQIQEMVREKAIEIAQLTHKALSTIDPNLAQTLTPKFLPPTAAKWSGLFSVGLDTDDNVPLNKRGSGVRRLILVSFFKAEAERKLSSTSKANIIYAIEEPETSQHPTNQRILIESFKEISASPNCQVILTTHSPGLASELPAESIRFISATSPTETPTIRQGVDVFGEVAEALGLIPDSRVKVLVCVEGPSDVDALKHLSHALHQADNTIPSLLTDPRCAFVLLGGSTLKHWVTSHYLGTLGLPELHIYDGDVATYGASVAEVNARQDGLNSWAAQTIKHEIECYLHPDAIFEEFGINVNVVDEPDAVNLSVPKSFGIEYALNKGWASPMGDNKSKSHLTRAFKRMTADRIRSRDQLGEVEGWFRRLDGYF